MKSKLNWMDKAISFLNPKAGYERNSWRCASTGYDSGSNARNNAGWSVVNAPAEQTNQLQRDTIRARARDLERNSDIAESIIGVLERNVVCSGIKLQAKAIKANGEDDEELNIQIESLWDEWCRKENCDITGQQSFAELQAMSIRRTHVDGGILFIKTYIKNGLIPFTLQAREVDELDSSMNSTFSTKGKTRVINGIELDEFNKPTAYYLRTQSPDGLFTGDSKRIPADRVIHLFRKNRPSQIREMSQLARTAGRIRDINEYIQAVSVKERILACLSIFIKKKDPTGTLGRGVLNTDSESGYKVETIAPGMINYLQPGDDVTSVNPSGQASNAKEFLCVQQRLAGSGQGLSYESVSRDMSQVNYSSARQGLLEDQRTYQIWQKFLVEHLLYEVYIEFLTAAVLSGKINIRDFWINKSRYIKHEWIMPGWSWIDPLKEVKAYEIALNTGQTTLSQISASSGNDWRDTLKQRAKEQEYMKKLGLDFGGKNEQNNSAPQNINGDNGQTKK